MEAAYRTADGRITFKVQGEHPKDLLAAIAALQEVFEAEKSCGVCNSTNIRFLYRLSSGYKFYEMVCGEQGCRARFSFGQAKEGGGLFPKRRDDDGNWLPNRGWEKYVKPGSNEASAPTTRGGNAGPPPMGPPDDRW